MPVTRRNQTNAMLYTLIAFVGLFIVATTIAVIYYVKFEDERTIAERSKRELREMVDDRQWQNRGNIVGTKRSRETYLGKMVEYLDGVVSLVVGGPLKQTSAQVKVTDANRQVEETLTMLAQKHIEFENVDPNTDGLLRIIAKLEKKLANTIKAKLDLNQQLEQLESESQKESAINFETIQDLRVKNEQYKQEVERIRKDYDKLEALLGQTCDQRTNALMAERDTVIAERKKTRNELLRTQAQLQTTQDKMKRIQQELWKIKPPPDMEVAAFEPDGTIVSVYNQIVHLNIGTDDRVYQGLTFSVYDQGIPIPKDGKGKAEIEVFDVLKNVSLARVTHSQIRRPIVEDDIVANLVWDSDKTNLFAVVGDFDLDDDGNIDYAGADRIKELIKKWGGAVADTVSADTDYLVLGRPPKALDMPTPEQMETDPTAMEKYQASLQEFAHYNQVQSQAQALWVPVFNTERFLRFTGYKTLASRPDAFSPHASIP